MKTEQCPTCAGVGTVEVPDPVKDHVCHKWCGSLHHRYSHASYLTRHTRLWTDYEPIASMERRGKSEFSINITSSSFPFIPEDRLRAEFRLVERATGKVVTGSSINLSPSK